MASRRVPTGRTAEPAAHSSLAGNSRHHFYYFLETSFIRVFFSFSFSPSTDNAQYYGPAYRALCLSPIRRRPICVANRTTRYVGDLFTTSLGIKGLLDAFGDVAA